MRPAAVWLKIFARLLRLYPPGFQAEFGDEMQQVFLDALTAAGQRGRGSVLATLARELAELIFNIGREHVVQWKGTFGTMAQLQTTSGQTLQTWGWAIFLLTSFLLISSGVLFLDYMTAVWSYLPHTLLYCGAWALLVWFWPAHSGSRPARTKWVVLAVMLIAVFAARTATWNSRKAILIDVRQVQTGTTLEEVDRLMADYMRSPAAPGSLSDHINIVADTFEDLALRATRPGEGTVIYRHTTEGWGNSDWVIINFENFRVTRVSFSPD